MSHLKCWIARCLEPSVLLRHFELVENDGEKASINRDAPAQHITVNTGLGDGELVVAGADRYYGRLTGAPDVPHPFRLLYRQFALRDGGAVSRR